MAHLPYRTGLPTIKILLRNICRLINKFRELWTDFMTPEQLAKMDELYALCMTIVAIIDELFSE